MRPPQVGYVSPERSGPATREAKIQVTEKGSLGHALVVR